MIHRADSFQVLPSAARTATVNDVDRHNKDGHKGIVVVIDVTAITATPSLTLRVQMKDPIGNKYVNIASTAAIVAISTTRLLVYPGTTPAANAVISEPLPDLYRIIVEHSDADSATYSVFACLMP
jgi:hypothetical protein